VSGIATLLKKVLGYYPKTAKEMAITYNVGRQYFEQA
jgi:hypothetical protein